MSARRAAFAGGTALLCMALCYLVLTAARVSALWYIPLEHRWAWQLPRGAVGIDWYFRGGASLAAGATGFALGRALAVRAAWATRPATLRTLLGLAFSVMAWAVLFMVFALATTPRARTSPTAPAPDAPEHND